MLDIAGRPTFAHRMRIGELAQAVGVSTDTVRFYESKRLLPAPARRDNDYRDYGEADAEHLRLMTELRRLDVSLPEAARLASLCHSGHCSEMTLELPEVIAERRASTAAPLARLPAPGARPPPGAAPPQGPVPRARAV